MHQIIYALVEASTTDEALAVGRSVFDRLVGTSPEYGAVFDYYVTFDDDSTSVGGKARWGELPTAEPIDSDSGQELLERGWEATKQEFERNLERVREGIQDLNTEAIMRDKELIRHACYNLGAYRGPSLFLYNEFAEGIRHRDQLGRVLESDEQMWIVPADVHY
ncbi:hypothetical protein [Haloferax marisrubri]|uniref:DUF7995 domain-containing protein n=1 Tax=Haloferax marisrubri TaxID=1544719 RepID=A0A2P4NLW9_9EURY|nr:hypothetical protein [Haloferax marisrubri]POG54145.1 hypothetical protein AUR65_015850 [Haloferax marisrubri]